MKYLLILILLVSLSLTGCYTVLWTPDQEFPTEESYYGSGSGYEDSYYADPYYGGYSYYYESPWWLTMAPPTRSTTKDRTENDRNGRSEEVREIRRTSSGDRSGDTTTAPPTRSSTTTSGTTNPNTGSTQSTERKNDNSGSADERNKIRNSGDRNSGGGRK
jgi:hypothetical protein